MIGMGTLDDVTIAAFMSFVRDDLTELIDPEEILSTEDFSEIEARIEKISVDKEGTGERIVYLQFVPDYLS